MERFTSVDEALDFAIAREEEAHGFYVSLAARMTRASLRELFLSFAQEEKRHKEKLNDVKKGRDKVMAGEKITDLRVGDYSVDAVPSAEMDYQDALLLAMQREKASFRLYTDLAASTPDEPLSQLLGAIAQEEAKHKLRFEIEYDQEILTDN